MMSWNHSLVRPPISRPGSPMKDTFSFFFRSFCLSEISCMESATKWSLRTLWLKQGVATTYSKLICLIFLDTSSISPEMLQVFEWSWCKFTIEGTLGWPKFSGIFWPPLPLWTHYDKHYVIVADSTPPLLLQSILKELPLSGEHTMGKNSPPFKVCK